MVVIRHAKEMDFLVYLTNKIIYDLIMTEFSVNKIELN